MKYSILNLENIIEKYRQNIGELSPFDVGIPLFECEDKTIEQIYYYRFHTFCKHIRKTPEGYVITEYYPKVQWSQKYNAINCPAAHHLYEGRWLYEPCYLESYLKFWFRDKDVNPRVYSCWYADAVEAFCKAKGDFSLFEELYEELKANYSLVEEKHKRECGLFYQQDGYDGMELSVSGNGLRTTINSYMYGDAMALSGMAKKLNRTDDERLYREKAEGLKQKIDKHLWNDAAQFYENVADDGKFTSSNVREELGYIPWYFNLPDEDKSVAWRFLMDKDYFYAPYGPTTTEQICPDFMKPQNHGCWWNGPSWPFATSQTLSALANLLCNYTQDVIGKDDYYHLLHIYANSQYDIDENGNRVPYIDENLHPITGEWHARSILRKGGGAIIDGHPRGKDYNHSTFCDLVISGLAGVRAREDDLLEINPLFTKEDIGYFCLDGVLYHGKSITVLWDADGTRYNRGRGLYVYCDDREVAKSEAPSKIRIELKQTAALSGEGDLQNH